MNPHLTRCELPPYLKAGSAPDKVHLDHIICPIRQSLSGYDVIIPQLTVYIALNYMDNPIDRFLNYKVKVKFIIVPKIPTLLHIICIDSVLNNESLSQIHCSKWETPPPPFPHDHYFALETVGLFYELSILLNFTCIF